MFPIWIFIFAIAALCATTWAKTRSRAPLPPGPSGRWPFLGLTFDMPKGRPWEFLALWAHKYGPLVYYRVGLRNFVVVSDPNIVRELLDKRSSNYSSRPPSEVGDLVSGGMRSVLMPYGPRWRRFRRIFANLLTEKKCEAYLPIQQKEAVLTLSRLAQDSNMMDQEMHRYALSVARSIAFGTRVRSTTDPFAVQVKTLMDQFADVMTPGKYLFESIPSLRRLPRFMQPWLAKLERIRDYEHDFSLLNYRNALQAAEKRPDCPCIAVEMRKQMETEPDVDEAQAASTCMEILGAGSDTTANSLLFVIMGLLSNPEAQRKAHEELDRVVGADRLPTWADEPNLPYIRAIIKEQHRWRSIAPMSFAHWSEMDDIVMGYRIPKKAVIQINTWAIHQNTTRYPNPDQFKPERFLSHSLSASAYANSSNVGARDHFSYGGGKRICVGLHLAERSLFTMTSRLLQVFRIEHALDAQGYIIPVDPSNVRTGLIMSPQPFKAKFEYRNNEAMELLQREYKENVENAGESWWN